MPLTLEEERNLSEEEKRAVLQRRSRRSSTTLSPIQAQKFLQNKITGAELARNPNLQPRLAVQFNERANALLRKKKGTGVVPREDPGGGVFGRHVFDFHTEQQRLRREFIDKEVLDQFGPQNVTSVSTVLNPQGGRSRAPGLDAASTTPTQAQLDEISARFETPLQKLTGGANKPFVPGSDRGSAAQESLSNRLRSAAVFNAQNAGGPETKGSGRSAFAANREGRVERRAVRRAARKTILTSDSDQSVGGSTILG